MHPIWISRPADRPHRLVSRAAALVWFKRDLRVRDHAPWPKRCTLTADRPGGDRAAVAGKPRMRPAPCCFPACLRCRTAARSGGAWVCRCWCAPVPCRRCCNRCGVSLPFTHLFSHEETGPGWSYTRDLAVADWCRSQGVSWTELPQTGVVRRLRSRTGWAGRWAQRMNARKCGGSPASGERLAWSPAPFPRCATWVCPLWAQRCHQAASAPRGLRST
jgi:deoxyribodipyrimidine photo-lyase